MKSQVESISRYHFIQQSYFISKGNNYARKNLACLQTSLFNDILNDW